MRRKIYIIGILCGILLLTGCEKGKNISNKAEQITSNVIKKASYKDGDTIQKQIDTNIKINAEVNIPESLQSLKINKTKAYRPNLNEKNIKEIFFQKNDKLFKNIDSGYNSREFGKYDSICYTSADGASLIYEPADIEYSNLNREYYLNCLFTDPQFEDYNLDRYPQSEELSFAKKEKVFQKIKKVFDTLNIPISEDYTSYSLNHKQLKKEEKAMDSNGNIHTENEKKSWKEDDDAYYFILHQEINGVPIEQSGYGDGYTGTGVEETKLEVIYVKKGWISFEEQWGYSLEQTDTVWNIIPVKKALEYFQKKCDMLVLNEKWNISEISLKLLPVFKKNNDYEIRPVWFFEGDSLDQDKKEHKITIIFDAITGKEITT